MSNSPPTTTTPIPYNDEDDQEWDCPLCMEEMDIHDQHFRPCPCGYQVCRFCWHRIRENGTGACPACRRRYTEEGAETLPIPPEVLAIEKQKRKERKERKEAALNEATVTGSTPAVPAAPSVASPPLMGTNASPIMLPSQRHDILSSRKAIAEYRVIQRNLVYVIGISPKIATEAVLRSHEFFGQHGGIIKVVVNKRNLNMGTGNSVSAYVTYKLKEDAAKAIQGMDGCVYDGRVIRATYGTTKYCSFYLRGLNCPNAGCMYLHDQGDMIDSFTKEQLTLGSHQLQIENHQGQKKSFGLVPVDRTDARGSGGAGGVGNPLDPSFSLASSANALSAGQISPPPSSSSPKPPPPAMSIASAAPAANAQAAASSPPLQNERAMSAKLRELFSDALDFEYSPEFIHALRHILSGYESAASHSSSTASVTVNPILQHTMSIGTISRSGSPHSAIGSSRHSSEVPSPTNYANSQEGIGSLANPFTTTRATPMSAVTSSSMGSGAGNNAGNNNNVNVNNNGMLKPAFAGAFALGVPSPAKLTPAKASDNKAPILLQRSSTTSTRSPSPSTALGQTAATTGAGVTQQQQPRVQVTSAAASPAKNNLFSVLSSMSSSNGATLPSVNPFGEPTPHALSSTPKHPPTFPVILKQKQGPKQPVDLSTLSTGGSGSGSGSGGPSTEQALAQNRHEMAHLETTLKQLLLDQHGQQQRKK